MTTLHSTLQHWLRALLLFPPIHRDELNKMEILAYTTISALPALLLAVSACAYAISCQGSPRIAQGGRLLKMKTTSGVALVLLEVWRFLTGLQFTLSTSSSSNPNNSTSFLLSLIAAVCLAIIVNREHIFSHRSSAHVTLYLIFSLIADVLQTTASHDASLEMDSPPPHSLLPAIMLAKCSLIILQEQRKTPTIEASKQNSERVQDAVGPLSRTFYPWIQTAFLLGFRADFETANLAALGPGYSSEKLLARFEMLWARTNQQSSIALTLISLGLIKWKLIVALLLYAISAILRLNISRVLGETLTALYQSEPSSQTVRNMAIQTWLVYSGLCLFQSLSKHVMNKACLVLRSALMAALMKKNMDMHGNSTQEAEVTSLSLDIENIVEVVCQLHELLIDVPTLFYGIYLLHSISGKAIVAFLMCKLVWSFYNLWIASARNKATATWSQHTHERVSFILAAINNLRATRMIGAEKVTIESAQQLCDREIEASKSFHTLAFAYNAFAPWESYFTTGALIFGCLHLNVWPDGLEPALLFPALILDDLLFFPTIGVLQVYPQTRKLLTHFERIRKFLSDEGHRDHRILRDFTNGQKLTRDELLLPLDDDLIRDRSRCIAFNAVSVADTNSGAKTFEHLQMAIHTDTLTVVMGPAGSGKTMLLKTIVGETNITRGWLHVATKNMAYCGQNAWLPNATIKDIVVGEEPFDEHRFSEALHACCLDGEMPNANGDDTIGINGEKLDRGQRHQLALARAIYSGKRIVVIDDVLSRLDSSVASDVFERVFSRAGLLKQQRRTAVLASNTVEWMAEADHIIEIDAIGNVTSQKDRHAMAKIIEHSRYTAPLVPPIPNEPTTDYQDHDAWELAITEETRNVEDPIRATDWKLHRFLFQSLSRKQMTLYCFSAVVTATIELLVQPYFWVWLERDPLNRSYANWIFILGTACTACNAVLYWFSYCFIVPKIATKTHSLFLEAAMTAKLSFLTSKRNNALLVRLTQDLTSLNHEIPFSIFRFLFTTWLLIFQFGCVMLVGRHSIIPLLLLGSVLYTVQHFYTRAARRLRLLDIKAKATLHNNIYEDTSGIEHIRSFGWRSARLRQSLAVIDRAQMAAYYMQARRDWLATVLQLCSALLGGSLVFFTVTGVTSASSLGMALQGVLHINWTLEKTVERWAGLQASLNIVRRIKEFVEETPVETDTDMDPEISIPESWPTTGAVDFQRVSATYNLAPHARVALENVSFSVEHGQTVLIGGRRGSGKSGLLLTALNCLEHVGTVLIDDVDIKNVPKERLRRCITTIPQGGYELLEGTVRDNLLPHESTQERNPLTTDRIMHTVLEMVGLFDYIQENGGYNATLSELDLSSGQLQLLNIARAILHHRITGSKLIFMDEATSNLDANTDEIIQEVLLVCFADCTRFIISHKSLGQPDCDVRFTLRNGAIVRQERLLDSATSTSTNGLIVEPRRRAESAPASLAGSPERNLGWLPNQHDALPEDQASNATAFKDGKVMQSSAAALKTLEVTFSGWPGQEITCDDIKGWVMQAADTSPSSSSSGSDILMKNLKEAFARVGPAFGDGSIKTEADLKNASASQKMLLICQDSLMSNWQSEKVEDEASKHEPPESVKDVEKRKMPEEITKHENATTPNAAYVSRQAFQKDNRKRDGFLNPVERTQSEVFSPTPRSTMPSQDPGEGPSSRLFEEGPANEQPSDPRFPMSLDIIRRAFHPSPAANAYDGPGYSLFRHSSDYQRPLPSTPPSGAGHKNSEFHKKLHRMKLSGRGPAPMHAVFHNPPVSPRSSERARRRDCKKMGKPWPPRARSLADSPAFWTAEVKGLSDDGKAPSLDSEDGELTTRTVLSTRVHLINDMLTNKYGPSTYCQNLLHKLAEGELVDGPGFDKVMEVLVRNSPYSSRGRSLQF